MTKPTPHRYRSVVVLLAAASFAGMAGLAIGGLTLANPVLLDAAVALCLAAGVLLGVARQQGLRTIAPTPGDRVLEPPPEIARERGDVAEPATRNLRRSVEDRLKRLTDGANIRVGVASAGALGIGLVVLISPWPQQPPLPIEAGVWVAICLVAAGLAATTVRYLAELDGVDLPEAMALARGARVVAWILVFAAISIGLEWADQLSLLRILHLAVLAVSVSVSYDLATSKPSEANRAEAFPTDFAALSLLGGRTNMLGSVLDAGEAQLGIDLRSTWAITIVRRSLEPLIIGLALVGWLATALTVIGVQEQGLVERLGVPQEKDPLQPGIHVHWPWPVDRVFRIPVRLVQAVQVGHEGDEAAGPENVLWAVAHAPNEYTLLLGNGRDLITVDAAVQFRIIDARAWRYHTQNPADALRAISYRAVMRSTVNRTLSEALSENVVKLTGRMRSMVQDDANALGLGVEIMGFTVGGMHPPVPVAADYEAVVSAQLQKVTEVVNAQVYRNRTVPSALASVLANRNAAEAEGVQALARAAGEAWGFNALESQYRADPADYLFRRRLEALEKGLTGRCATIVDSRIQRDGGELWVVH
jgi:regulator of protease activity HflC (stomatin/prohibitin superfamily)